MTETAPTNAWLAAQDPAKVAAGVADLRANSDHPRLADLFRNDHFALWMTLCDDACARLVGVGIFDIADWGWADAYDSGDSPRSAVRGALENDDTFAELFAGE